MKLLNLTEATLRDIERRIPIFLKKYYQNILPDRATKQIEQLAKLDPTRGKYTEWIIRQHNKNNIRIPEDNEKITRLLKQFHQHKQQLSSQDINHYTPGILAKALDQIAGVSKRQAKKTGRAGQLTLPPGTELVYDRPPYQVVKITDAKASTIICSGTEWCTANMDTAEDYLKDGPLYIVYKNGERYALAHACSGQVTDVYDEEFTDEKLIQLLELLMKVDLDFGLAYTIESGKRTSKIESHIMKNPELAYSYARWVIKGRWPKVEPSIMKNPELAYNYARDVIKGRWSKVEPSIMKNPELAYDYARDVIGGRWPEAEPFIVKDPSWAYNYARYVIKGRWPEAEPSIMKDPEKAFYYARYTIKGRWPEAEPSIMKDPGLAYNYARGVIGGRWPEAEPFIVKDPSWAYNYARYVIKGRWPEAEPSIMKDPTLAHNYARDVMGVDNPDIEGFADDLEDI